MRIIAGTHRSRPLVAPPGRQIRPTSDRLRETLFNVLTPRIARANCADLYAGTGAVGIEALSRGARHVLFVESAAPAVTSIRANLERLGIASGFTIEARRVTATLDHLPGRISERLPDEGPGTRRGISLPGAAFDIVFLDPPYEASAEYMSTLSILGSARGQLLLAPDALIVAEHSSKMPLPESFGMLQRTRTLKQGDAALTFYSGCKQA